MGVMALLVMLGCGGQVDDPSMDTQGVTTWTPDGSEGDVDVVMQTSLGEIQLTLDGASAPRTVRNFVRYAEAGFFDGADGDGATVFHRVIPGFMIQGGGLRADLTAKGTRKPIQNEADNGLRNVRGSIAMARTSNPESATSQFFVNHKDNPGLDGDYAVFGEVTVGLEVVDAIAAVSTQRSGDFDDVPVEPVVIEAVTVSADGT